MGGHVQQPQPFPPVTAPPWRSNVCTSMCDQYVLSLNVWPCASEVHELYGVARGALLSCTSHALGSTFHAFKQLFTH